MKQEANEKCGGTAYYHLPCLFEFYGLYSLFLPLFYNHREYFYDWCRIASLYGTPADCIWGGGRVGSGERSAQEVLALTRAYGLSARLTFSNSLLRPEHLSDGRCNALCRVFARSDGPQNGVIVHSDLLLDHLRRTYPGLYFVSSTTKVLTDFSLLRRELERLARERGLKVYLPDKPLCGDNAAMIASQGYYEYLAGNTAGMDLNACAQRSIE